MADTDFLQQTFGVEVKVAFVKANGLTKAVLTNKKAVAEIYTHGAHVARWCVNGQEGLWMSDAAEFARKKPIRGGIPICWPQFGGGKLPQHGFLRTSDSWLVDKTDANAACVSITLKHTENEETLAIWPFPFEAHYTIELRADTLTTSLKVLNTGSTTAFNFTAALHTYFAVPRIETVAVNGLAQLTYLDKLQDLKEVTEGDAPVAITQETDRVYLKTPNKLTVDTGSGQYVVSKHASLPDAVLWNPWTDKAKAIADFHDDGFHKMVCLEAGAVKDPVTLGPGAHWTGSQTLSMKGGKQA